VSAEPAWFEDLARRLPGERPPFGPPVPDGAPVRDSAVLMLFGEGPEGHDLLLTQRSHTMRSHPGQVAFPGGGAEPGDDGPTGTALREAQEEAGLDPAGVDVRAVGAQIYLPASRNHVSPVLGWWRERSALAPGDPAEVSRVVTVPVAELVEPTNRFTVVHPSGFAGPAFAAADMLVWGFTAGIVSWVLRLSGLERPWDSARTVPLPEQPLIDRADVGRLLERRFAE
jgi:8-oxo-dGTP pyrophosphatase MutT (NUDIX family)